MCCVSITIHDENHGESDHEHPLLHLSIIVLQNSSSVSVVFDFNASLNDVAPVSPMLFSVEFYENEKSWVVDGCHLCVVSFVFTTQIELSECCV